MKEVERPAFRVLLAICFCHLLNDMLQSLLVASYPTFKAEFHLNFTQIGLVTLAYQLTASLLQPVVGLYADRRPMPFSLPAGTLFTFAGLAPHGNGAPVRHAPRRRVRPRDGLVGLSPGVVPGRPHGLGRAVLASRSPSSRSAATSARRSARLPLRSSSCAGEGAESARSRSWRSSPRAFSRRRLWYRRHGLRALGATAPRRRPRSATACPRDASVSSLVVLLVLVFSKFVYLAGFTSYYTFYLMHRFGLSRAERADAPLRVPRGRGRSGRWPEARSAIASAASRSSGSRSSAPSRSRSRSRTPTSPGRARSAWSSASCSRPRFRRSSSTGRSSFPAGSGSSRASSSASPSGRRGSAPRSWAASPTRRASSTVYQLCAVLPAMGLLAALLPDVGHVRQLKGMDRQDAKTPRIEPEPELRLTRPIGD